MANEDEVIRWGGPVAVYAQVAGILRYRIHKGEFGPDGRLPSEKEIGDAFGVGRKTARAAVQKLRDEGLVYTVAYRGTFVRGDT